MLFVVLFAVCSTLVTALVGYCPDSFLNRWIDLTIFMTKAMCLLLGLAATSNADIITVNGFAMRIITQCTALHYIIIIATAILLYTRHSIQYRLAGLVVSVVAVVIANAVRLVVTGVIGSISWDAFVIMHDYLWVAAFSLLVLALWIVWAEKMFAMSGNTAWRAGRVVLICSAAYGTLYLTMPLYGRLMAHIASLPLKFFLRDLSAEVVFVGERMLYTYSGGTFTANFAADLMVVALYIGLVLSAGNYEQAAIRRGMYGLAFVVGMCAAIISVGGAIRAVFGKNSAVLFLWTAHGLLLQLTMLWRMQRNKRQPQFSADRSCCGEYHAQRP